MHGAKWHQLLVSFFKCAMCNFTWCEFTPVSLHHLTHNCLTIIDLPPPGYQTTCSTATVASAQACISLGCFTGALVCNNSGFGMSVVPMLCCQHCACSYLTPLVWGGLLRHTNSHSCGSPGWIPPTLPPCRCRACCGVASVSMLNMCHVRWPLWAKGVVQF